MPSAPTTSLDDALAHADRLLLAHTKRSPQVTSLKAVEVEIDRLTEAHRSAAAQRRLAEIAFCLGNVDLAISHLEVEVDQDSRSTAARIELLTKIAQHLAGWRQRDIVVDALDLRRTFAKLSAMGASISGLAHRRTSVFELLALKQPLKALELAINPDIADPDAVAHASYILQRLYAGSVPEARQAIIQKVIAGIVDRKMRFSLSDLCFQLENDSRARAARADAGAGPDPLEISAFLEERRADGVRALVRAKDIFLSVYPHDETIKIEIVRKLQEQVLARGSAASAKRLLECSAQTIAFWQDAEFRSNIIDSAEQICAADQSGEGDFIRGINAFLQNDLESAGKWFSAASTGSLQLSLTGATSFFTDLTEADEARFARVETDFSRTKRTDRAYVCCADERFFRKHAQAYAKSARLFEDGTRLHFHIASDSPEAAYGVFDDYLSDYENVSVSWELPAIATPTYFASMRFLRAEQFLQDVADRIVMTDIDVQFNASPASFINYSEFEHADAGFRIYDKVRVVKQATGTRGAIYRYPRLLPWSIVNAACVMINSSIQGKSVARQVASDMRRHLGRALKQRDGAWWIDQNSLLMSLRAVAGPQRANIVSLEDVGIPFGSFDYSAVSSFATSHPALPALGAA